MAKKHSDIGFTGGTDYELLPHKEIMELREQLQQLKNKPTERNLQVAMVELSAKLDKMVDIFEEARHEIKIEEGGLTFQERMRPMMNRMEKILEQNSQIAEGIVAVADLIGEIKDGVVGGSASPAPETAPPMPEGPSMASPMPPMPGPTPPLPPPPGAGAPAGMPPPPPMPPPPKKKGLF